MPAPDAAIVAYGVIVVVPLAILAWYWSMYSDIGKTGLTGGTLGREAETEPEREGDPEA